MAKKPKPTIHLPEFVSLPEAAALANVSERHMRLLVSQGQIPAAKVGRNWLVSRAAAVAFTRHPTLGRPRRDKYDATRKETADGSHERL